MWELTVFFLLLFFVIHFFSLSFSLVLSFCSLWYILVCTADVNTKQLLRLTLDYLSSSYLMDFKCLDSVLWWEVNNLYPYNYVFKV